MGEFVLKYPRCHIKWPLIRTIFRKNTNKLKVVEMNSVTNNVLGKQQEVNWSMTRHYEKLFMRVINLQNQYRKERLTQL